MSAETYFADCSVDEQILHAPRRATSKTRTTCKSVAHGQQTYTLDSEKEESCQDAATSYLVSNSQVEALLCDLTRHIDACMRRKNELHHDIQTTLTKARARYVSGGTASALVSMRRIAKLRVELARVGACRCRLMEIFVQVKAEFQKYEGATISHDEDDEQDDDDDNDDDDDDDDDEDVEEDDDDDNDDEMSETCECGEDYSHQSQLIDLDLDFFRLAMEQTVQRIHAPKHVKQTDEDLLEELA